MYDITQFFLFRPVFVLELLIGELLFACQLPRRRYFWLRLLAMALFLIGLSCAIPQIYINPGFNLFYYSSYFFLIFVLSLLGLRYFCLKASFRDCLFAAVAGYSVQHFSSELFMLISNATGLNGQLDFNIYGSGPLDLKVIASNLAPFFFYVFIYVLLFSLVYFFAFLYFGHLLKRIDFSSFHNPMTVSLAALVLLFSIVASGVVTYCFPNLKDRFLLSLLDSYNLVCCLLAFILFVELPHRQALALDLQRTEQLREKEKERYKMSEENVEQINIRCHDLKKSLQALTAGRGLDQGSVEDIEKQINIYDDSIVTKNAAINVVLAEKALFAEKNHIKLSFIIDGSAMDFMKESDVYFLFSNIMDNAIEAVMKGPESQRSIGLTLKRQGGFVVLHSYNWFVGGLTFKDGLPETTKGDKGSHGFGLKSIKSIIERYGGSLNVKASEGIFELNALFSPSPKPANGH